MCLRWGLDEFMYMGIYNILVKYFFLLIII